MALDKVSLVENIEAALKKAFSWRTMPTGNDTEKAAKDAAEESYNNLAIELADAFDTFVRTASVNTTVSTTGTATKQEGFGTGGIT